ncbi:MAG TPA: hypothetical protein VNU68_09825 [Verrucomicrobiae bacterium]|nr:hypothetical protein [Verrucomicrobiae bacterium]
MSEDIEFEMKVPKLPLQMRWAPLLMAAIRAQRRGQNETVELTMREADYLAFILEHTPDETFKKACRVLDFDGQMRVVDKLCDPGPWTRACGETICDRCNRPYFEHPADTRWTWLRVTCCGMKVKL